MKCILQHSSSASPPPTATGSVRRLLILDDDPTTLRLLTDYLRAPELDLITCAEIEAALCLLEHHRFDVLITDLAVSNLGGLEGMRLIRHAASNFPDIRVIVFSGRLDEEVRKLARALGATDVLAKPTDLRRLRALVKPETSHLPRAPHRTLEEASHVQLLDEFLEERAISAVLQPIVEFDPVTYEPRPVGVEGLARGPRDSLLSNPELLLDYASRKGRLLDTEMQCIEAALTEARVLPADAKLFLNVRPRTLSAPEAATELIDLVQRFGRQTSQVVLELTEQQTILNPRAFHDTLQALCKSGFDVALDDYGRGFANLHLVQELRPHYLKIDGFFCNDIHLHPSRQAMVRSTVTMAEKLGISTIMEHVESLEELQTVRELGVTYAQGYYFSKPLPGRELESWFGSSKAAPAASLQTAVKVRKPVTELKAEPPVRWLGAA